MASQNKEGPNNKRSAYIPIPLVPRQGTENNQNETNYNLPHHRAMPLQDLRQRAGNNNPQAYCLTQQEYKRQATNNIPELTNPVPPLISQQIARNNNPQSHVSQQQVHSQVAGNNSLQAYVLTQQGYGQQATNNIPQHCSAIPPQIFQQMMNQQPNTSTQGVLEQQAGNNIPQYNVSQTQMLAQVARNNPQHHTSMQPVRGQGAGNNVSQCDMSPTLHKLQQLTDNKNQQTHILMPDKIKKGTKNKRQPQNSKRKYRKKTGNNIPEHDGPVPPQILQQIAGINNPQGNISNQQVYRQVAGNNPQYHTSIQQVHGQRAGNNIPQYNVSRTQMLAQVAGNNLQHHASVQRVLGQEAGNNIPQYNASQTLQTVEQIAGNNPQSHTSMQPVRGQGAGNNVSQCGISPALQKLQQMVKNNNTQSHVSQQQVHGQGAGNNPQAYFSTQQAYGQQATNNIPQHCSAIPTQIFQQMMRNDQQPNTSTQGVLEQQAGNNIPQYVSQTLQELEQIARNSSQHCASTKKVYKKKTRNNILQHPIPPQMPQPMAGNNNPQCVSEKQVHRQRARNNSQSHASMPCVLGKETENYDISKIVQQAKQMAENYPRYHISIEQLLRQEPGNNIPQCGGPIPQMFQQIAGNNNPQDHILMPQVHEQGARNNPQAYSSTQQGYKQKATNNIPLRNNPIPPQIPQEINNLQNPVSEPQVHEQGAGNNPQTYSSTQQDNEQQATNNIWPCDSPIPPEILQILGINSFGNPVSEPQVYEEGAGNNPQVYFSMQQDCEQETTNNFRLRDSPIPQDILMQILEDDNMQGNISEQEVQGEEAENNNQPSILFRALSNPQANDLQHRYNNDVRNSSLVRYQRNFSHSRPPPAETSGVAIETEQFFNSGEHLSSGVSPAAVQVPPFAPQTNFSPTALPTTVGFVAASNHPNAIVPGGVCNSTAGGDKNDDSCPEHSVLKNVDTRSSAEPHNQRSSAVLENIELSFADDIPTIESVEEQLIDDTTPYNIIGSSNTQTGEQHIPTSDVTSDMKYETQSGPPPAQPHMTSTGVEPPHSSQGPGMMVGSSPTDAEGVTVMLPPWNGGAPDYLDQSGIKQSSQGLSDNWDSLLINQTLDGPQSQIAADRRPLPSFIGYTSNLSINGISGLHYHTIASSVQIAVMPSGSPTQSTNQEYYGSVVPDTQEYQEPPVVSSSTPCQQGSQKQQQPQQQHTNNQQHCNQYQHHHHNHHEQQAPQSTQQIDLDIEADIALLISNAIAADTTVSSGGSSGNDANSANDGATGNGNPSLVQEQDNTSRHTSPWNDIVDWFDTACTTNKHQEANVYTVYSTSSPAQTQQHSPSIPNLLTYSPLLQARLQAGNTETPSSTSTYPPVSPPGRVSTSGSPDQNLHSSYTAPSHSRKRSRGSQGTQNPAKKAATAISYSNDANMAGGKEKPVHRCSICSRGFLNKSNIKVHLRTHTGEKPFKCTTCEKTFRQKAHLIKHQQIHKRGSRD